MKCNSQATLSLVSIWKQKNASTTLTTGEQENITTGPSQKSIPDRASNYSSFGASTCLLQAPYCTLQGSSHALDGLRDVCILWDDSCSGNKTLAAERFFSYKSMDHLQSNPCFNGPTPKCTTSNPPGRISAFANAKNWMRTPQCPASGPAWYWGPEDERGSITCCNYCQIYADKVDVYDVLFLSWRALNNRWPGQRPTPYHKRHNCQFYTSALQSCRPTMSSSEHYGKILAPMKDKKNTVFLTQS